MELRELWPGVKGDPRLLCSGARLMRPAWNAVLTGRQVPETLATNNIPRRQVGNDKTPNVPTYPQVCVSDKEGTRRWDKIYYPTMCGNFVRAAPAFSGSPTCIANP